MYMYLLPPLTSLWMDGMDLFGVTVVRGTLPIVANTGTYTQSMTIRDALTTTLPRGHRALFLFCGSCTINLTNNKIPDVPGGSNNLLVLFQVRQTAK